jgi:hypothetical protein
VFATFGLGSPELRLTPVVAGLVPHKNLDSKIKERKTYIRHQKGLPQAQGCPVSKGTEWRGRRRNWERVRNVKYSLQYDKCVNHSFHWHVQNATIPCCSQELFPAILLHQPLFHPPSLHLAIYFLVYLSVLLFPYSYKILFWEFFFHSLYMPKPM